jgi:hypothetical protein
MKNRHIFNRSIQFGISRKALVAMAIIGTFPAVAMAGPSVGLGYSDIGITGHAGRPGVTLTAGNLYRNNVVASGSATVARGYYGMNAALGKMLPAGGVSFEPYIGLGFLNLNYNQSETGYTTTTSSNYGYSFTQTTPYSYNQPASITDFYGLAGVNLNIPIGQQVALQFGGGYGHTLMTFGGSGGAVYKGSAKAAFEIAPHVTANVNVAYLHVPGASMTSEGAGLSYHFS